MSKTDAIVLKANFDDWEKGRGTAPLDIDPWLYYSVDQFVKPYMLDDEEIESAITDGSGDGGADAIFIIVNQRQLVSEDTELDPKNVSKIRLIFFQVKRSGGFKNTEIQKFIELTDDFLDLSKESSSFGSRYNDDVVRAMRVWREQYINLSQSFPDIEIQYFYITGDDVSPDTLAEDSFNRVVKKANSHISKARCSYYYIGAKELWEQVQRRPPKSRILTWSEAPMNAPEGTVGLVKLKDYFEFIKDELESFSERMFESNVRGYQRDVGVNKQIRESLEQGGKGINFWVLNNGITIITENATSASHLKLSIQDPQIVNGLQTSREIFNYFSNSVDDTDERSVLLRVIETSDTETQEKIIKATNSQNRMMPSQLRMTDQIHRNIEELFKKEGLFYDRRKGFYRDQEKPIRKIISVNETAQAVISVLLQRPNDARARPGDYFKTDERYELIFGDGRFPLPVYLTCVELVRVVEQDLRARGVERSDIKNLKFYVAAFVARELVGKVQVVASELVKKDPRKVDSSTLEEVYKRVRGTYYRLVSASDGDTVARGTSLLRRLDRQSKSRFGKAKSKAKTKAKTKTKTKPKTKPKAGTKAKPKAKTKTKPKRR